MALDDALDASERFQCVDVLRIVLRRGEGTSVSIDPKQVVLRDSLVAAM